MEPFIVIIWFLFVGILPITFLIVAYISYINGVKSSEVILKLFVALIGYVCITGASFPFMFIVVFAGAHTEPVGNSLDLKGEIVYLALLLVYLIIGWLLSSFVNGSLIKPWKILSRSNEKNQSIFYSK